MRQVMNEGSTISSTAIMPRVNAVATIAIAQLLGTSLWFSANSAADDPRKAWGVSVADIGILTSAVQLGFILGTLVFALSGLADRFPASGSSPAALFWVQRSMHVSHGFRLALPMEPRSGSWSASVLREFIRLA
jgi:hypothetical protein